MKQYQLHEVFFCTLQAKKIVQLKICRYSTQVSCHHYSYGDLHQVAMTAENNLPLRSSPEVPTVGSILQHRHLPV